MEKRSRLWWKLLTRSFCQPAKRFIGSPCTYMLNKLVLWLATAIDISMTYGGPVYVIVGFSLILVVSYVYLATILPCIPGLLYQTLHLASGAVLLVNIILNYWLCTRTRPGSTASLKEGYHLAAGSSIKFCKHCRRAKPPLAHHCHICNECVLRMDHHCPWVNNCIGYFNYRYFFLFVLFLFLGSGYVAIQFWRRLTSAELVLTSNELRMMVFSLATSASSCFALGLLLCWHVYLILTAQSTVDFLRNRSAAMEARRQGKRWSNPYDLGAVPNWQDTFDVHGRFWWLLWLLPTWTPKKGNGFVLPTKNSQGVDSNSNADGFLTPRYPKDLETGHM